MRLSRITPFALALVLTVAACGDDEGGAQLQLTDQETAELFAVIGGLFDEFLQFSAANPGLNLSVSGLLVDINESADCPEGGSVSATGTDDSDENTLDFDADLDFNACQSEGWTLGGGLNFVGNGTSTETTLSVDLGISGTITAETPEGGSGSCTWDLDYSLDVDGEQVDFAVSGSICGRSFNQSG